MKTVVPVEEIADLFNAELSEIETKYCDDDFMAPGIVGKVKSVIDASCLMLQSIQDDFSLNQKDMRNICVNFHNRTNEVIQKSFCLNRTRTWPQGYQGDYKTLETIYRGIPLSSGIGIPLDLYALTSPLAVAVRNRILLLQNILRNELTIRQKLSMLNIACGSCRELMELWPDIRTSKARVTCIDDDNDALNFALNRLSYTSISLSNIKFRKYNAIRMFDYESNLREFGMHDIIYSVGLFDYLPDDILIKLLKSLYHLLTENGKLIAAFKDCSYYDSTPYHWIMDWNGFKQRDEKDFLNIFLESQIPIQNIASFRDETNIIIFYQITKK